MSDRITSSDKAEHYSWGENCDGWHLLRTESLHIIEEQMPAGTSEVRHRHLHARQFFYVLQGELTMELEGEQLVLKCGEGVEIAPGQRHQALNRSGRPVRFLVVSHPSSHGDRVLS